MKREERILILSVGVVVGAFAAVFATGLENYLGGRPWFSNGSNVIQWISGPSTLAAVVVIAYHYFTRRCAVRLCPRTGEHCVEGCLKKVCSHHHTRFHHALVHAEHAVQHAVSGRLGWGESHSTPEKP